MTKPDLIEKLAACTTLTRRDAEVVIDTIFGSIITALADTSTSGVEIRGFGSFRIRERPARQGRNPRSGVLVAVPATRVPFFRPGKELRALIDGRPTGAVRGDGTPTQTVSGDATISGPIPERA